MTNPPDPGRKTQSNPCDDRPAARSRWTTRIHDDQGFVQAGWIVVAGVLALVLFVMLFVVIFAGGQSEACGPQPGGVQPSTSSKAGGIPANYLSLYQKAGQEYGIPWNVLAGIGKVETGHGTSNLPGVHSGENYAGAGGPMQFLQATWDSFGVDGNGDGKKNRYDPADAIPGAANYLRHNHGNEGGKKLRKAIWYYNHSTEYVNTVLSWADKYADGDFSIGQSNGTAQSCLTDVAGGGAFGQRVVAIAMRYLKTPYLWGGGNENGPTGSACAHGVCGKAFDCSGLTMYAVAQASGMKIVLGHYTGNQINDRRGTRVGFSQLQPGDLVFFTHPGESVPHHVGIYRGGGTMIHAPSSGDWVKISKITSGYYRSEFAGGVRFAMPGGQSGGTK